MLVKACEQPTEPIRAGGGSLFGTFRRAIFGFTADQVTLARRGFYTESEAARLRLETIGRTFREGYHFALNDPDCDSLAAALQRIERELRGFAYEGAAMALYLLDRLTPWRRDRFRNFVRGPGESHTYMVHVGAGWAMARLPLKLEPALDRMDPMLRWLAVDGYGFHEAYFHASRAIERQRVPRKISGYARRAFDMGLGRGMWFVNGADVRRTVDCVNRFDARRRNDLWSGVGLACAYAGAVSESEIEQLMNAADEFRPQLAQGAAFAAKARERAGNPTAHTERACRILCNSSANDAAALTDEALDSLSKAGAEQTFEGWRRAIQARLSEGHR